MKFKNIIRYIIGSFCILVSLTTAINAISWQINKKNYNKEYVYKDNTGIYYEKNKEKQYITNIYNKEGEEVSLNLSSNNVSILYCEKSNPTKAIYLQNYNSDRAVENPIIEIYATILFLIIAYYAFPKKKQKHNGNIILQLYIIYVYIFLIAIGFIGSQIYSLINYNMIKGENNLVTARINTNYKLEGKNIYEYYVNGEKYIYSDGKETYSTTTKELYYNTNNPIISCEKGKAINLFAIIIGLSLGALTFPIVFSKNTMARRYKKAIG